MAKRHYPAIPVSMRSVMLFSICLLTGCSTAPIADFLDWVQPGGPSDNTSPRPSPGPRRPTGPDPILDGAELPPSAGPSGRLGAPSVAPSTRIPATAPPAVPRNPPPTVPPSEEPVLPNVDPVPGISNKRPATPTVSGLRIVEDPLELPGRPRN